MDFLAVVDVPGNAHGSGFNHFTDGTQSKVEAGLTDLSSALVSFGAATCIKWVFSAGTMRTPQTDPSVTRQGAVSPRTTANTIATTDVLDLPRTKHTKPPVVGRLFGKSRLAES